ncbi:hypothetical protein NMG60_11030479 [Bertholletia excelsa]
MAQDDFPLCSFPDMFEATTFGAFDELEELYKPFYPVWSNPPSPQTVLSPVPAFGEERQPEKLQGKEHFSGSSSAVAGFTPTALGVRHKKRKTQQKRVVVQVKAEGLSSDMWAWRKYGQKPIKGSPYPRSYYRCSSLKGCLARKQVERSLSDPEMFVVTYTAEHCHSQPTRRNSLAGTTRSKFSSAAPKTASSSTAAATGEPHAPPPSQDSSSGGSLISSSQALSPQTPSSLATCDMILGDDEFFLGLEDLAGGLGSKQFPATFSFS